MSAWQASQLATEANLLQNRAAVTGYFVAILCVILQLTTLIWFGQYYYVMVASDVILLFALVVTGWMAHNRDQHAKHSFDRLAERNRLLVMTEECANVGHWRLNFADDCIFWSDQTFAIHGVELGNPPTLEQAIAFFHEDDRELVQGAIEKARRTGEAYQFNARLVRADGEIRHTESVARVEYDRSGNAAAIFGIFADRTEDTRLRQELVRARDNAEAAGAAKATFLARMSHEIRTPMNGIVGFADLLLRDNLQEHQRQHVELIVESGKALTMLLNDILDLSKIDAGEMEINNQCVDLPSLVSRCAQMIEPQIREKGLEFELDIAGDVPRNFEGDPLRLRQILSNLLHNAVKFTDFGHIKLSAWTDHQEVFFEVLDTGIGIPKDVQTFIFDAFTQAQDAATNTVGGTGLGLAICLQLAELMDGKLHVSSKESMGSSFLLTLPLRYTRVTARPERMQVFTSDASDKRILLAEDYDINQMLVASMAEKAGFSLDVAQDGLEAVARVNAADQQGKPYSLVLMDLQMPKLDGMGAARKLRESGYDEESLPIVALSANAFPEDIDASLNAGMQAHIAKPMTYETFYNEVNRWLGSQSMAA